MSLFTLAIIVNPVQGFMNSVLQVRRWGKESADNKWFLCYVRPHRRAVKCVQLFLHRRNRCEWEKTRLKRLPVL